MVVYKICQQKGLWMAWSKRLESSVKLMFKNSIAVRRVKKLDIICIFPFMKLVRQSRLCTFFPATVINFCQKKYPLGLIYHFSHVQQHANCVACLQT
jgi:hypothetical protein